MMNKWKYCPYCRTELIKCEICEEGYGWTLDNPNFCGECAKHTEEILQELNGAN